MPFALVLIGLIMIVTGVKDTHKEFGQNLVDDFTGEQNFTQWIVAIGAVGALGYVPQLKTLSRAFMVLIILAIILSQRGLFARFSEAIDAGTAKPSSPGDDGVGTMPELGELMERGSTTSENARQNFSTFTRAIGAFL